jgi:hypothetical protein
MSAPPLPHRVFTHLLDDHTDVPSLEPIDVSSAFAFDFSEFGFALLSLDASSGEHDKKLSDGESRAVNESQLSRVEADHGWRILPPEIWQHIARFACTDGGYTGCVLSLVSREMRAITNPSRYHTLAFFNSRDIALFAAHLEHVGLARVVCVAMLIAPQPDANAYFSSGAWPHKTVDRMTVAAAALIVLRAAAPTLEMLCSVTWGVIGDKNILELIEFPVLRDLIWDECVLDPCTARRALPSLQRLHVSLFIRPETLVILAPNWSSCASPACSHQTACSRSLLARLVIPSHTLRADTVRHASHAFHVCCGGSLSAQTMATAGRGTLGPPMEPRQVRQLHGQCTKTHSRACGASSGLRTHGPEKFSLSANHPQSPIR